MNRKVWLSLLVVAFLFCMMVIGSAEAQGFECQPGSSILFGHYEQDNDIENGVEPIEWLVLSNDDDSAILISKYALDCQPYNIENIDVTWENCSLRYWLSESFMPTAFSDAEMEIILPVNVSNNDGECNPEWSTSGGNDTLDSAFLLSYHELIKYFGEDGNYKTSGTEYARALGAKFLGITSIGIGDTDWWLRSPGKEQNEATFIGTLIHSIANKKVADSIAVRPAIKIRTVDIDNSQFPLTIFENAKQLLEHKDYLAAYDLFASLAGFNNSDEFAKECYYQQALVLIDTNDLEGAIKLLETIGDYKEAYETCRKARYDLAVSYQEAGDYQQAIKHFTKAGQYEDSMSRLKACFDQEGISVYYFGAEAKKTGMDNGYSSPVEITGNDLHFGWRLGRFFMSGYTRVMDDSNGKPVFLKTLGDSVTLWFDLEQDIDALNGNKKLVINGDENGYDQSMGIIKTNMGRGALLIRHTDYQNSKTDPVIYTDYVLAKGTTAADTKVVLKEEGDYEVVLDYEIQDNDITHLFNKYGNYQIAFSFSIRNGNCMIYPFDVVTGAELQNSAVTENGFSLDLARSRYLDIDVKRTEFIETSTGYVEDERFNRPAKDGDQYTSQGIYTISVSNRYTGEKMTKTIFVGTEELLQEYVSNGFSMDRLN